MHQVFGSTQAGDLENRPRSMIFGKIVAPIACEKDATLKCSDASIKNRVTALVFKPTQTKQVSVHLVGSDK